MSVLTAERLTTRNSPVVFLYKGELLKNIRPVVLTDGQVKEILAEVNHHFSCYSIILGESKSLVEETLVKNLRNV